MKNIQKMGQPQISSISRVLIPFENSSNTEILSYQLRFGSGRPPNKIVLNFTNP